MERVFVCRRSIEENRKGASKPVFAIDRSGRQEQCHTVEVCVDGRVVGRFVHDPSVDGPKAWFEAVDCELRGAGA